MGSLGFLPSCLSSRHRVLEDYSRVPAYPKKPNLLDPLAYLAACGTLAPSPFNTQPWVFYPRPAALEVYPDFSRKREMADPQYRELGISLGAAGEAMRIAAPKAGFSADLEIGTTISTRTPAVVVRLSPSTQMDAPLYPQLFTRHTNRLLSMPIPIPATEQQALLSVPLPEGVSAFAMTDAAYMEHLAKASAALEKERLGQESMLPDISRWLRADCEEATRRGDGIALERLTRLNPYLEEESVGDYWHDQPAFEERRIRSAGMMVLVCTKDDTPGDWVRAGMASLRLMLQGETQRLRHQPHNQTVRSQAHIDFVRDLFHAGGVPQMLLRFGYAPAWGSSPRLAYQDVTLEPDQPSGPMDNWDI